MLLHDHVDWTEAVLVGGGIMTEINHKRRGRRGNVHDDLVTVMCTGIHRRGRGSSRSEDQPAEVLGHGEPTERVSQLAG